MNIPDPLNTSTLAGPTKGGSVSQVNSLAGYADRSHANGHPTTRIAFGTANGRENGSGNQIGLSSVPRQHQGKQSIPVWKRSFDLALILFSTPLWLPFFVLISAWIKLVSRGPVFFHQTRVGLGGQHFTILKFRSMKTGAETASHENHFRSLIENNVPMVKLDALNDNRLIPGGRILRATGLDELAQLLNVIRGEMSLVGPRPCTVNEFECYQEWQKARVNAPPGLTGYWQVNGKNRTTFNQMIEMDIKYSERMSLSLDLAIIAATPPAVLLQVVEATWRPAKSRARAEAAVRSSHAHMRGQATQQIS